MRLKKILIYLLVFCSVFMISIPVYAEEPADTYPCYCEKCVSAFNTKYNSYPLSSYDMVKLTGSNESLNGFYCFVLYSKNDKYNAVVFCKDFKIEINSVSSSASKLTVYNQFSFRVDSLTIDLSSVSLPNLGSENSFYINSYNFLYVPSSVDYSSVSAIRTSFEWPSHPSSEAEKFSNNFPSFITSCWSSLIGFIGDNKLVLFIFIIPVAFALIGLIKRCIK